MGKSLQGDGGSALSVGYEWRTTVRRSAATRFGGSPFVLRVLGSTRQARTVKGMSKPSPSSRSTHQELAAALGSPEMITAIAEALGVDVPDSKRAGADLLVSVEAFYIQMSDELSSVSMISGKRFIRYELTENAALTVAIPLKAIRRIAEVVEDIGITLIMEIEADMTTTEMMPKRDVNGQLVLTEAGEPVGVEITSHGGWLWNWTTSDDEGELKRAADLRRWARKLRLALASV